MAGAFAFEARNTICYAECVKLVILYRPDSEHSSTVESFVRDLRQRYGDDSKLELLSVNTRDGAATASLYDIMAYPSILALADNGSVLNVWQGEPLPLMDEVMGYVYS